MKLGDQVKCRKAIIKALSGGFAIKRVSEPDSEWCVHTWDGEHEKDIFVRVKGNEERLFMYEDILADDWIFIRLEDLK